MRTLTRLLLAALFVTGAAAPVIAKEYRADRFDVQIDVAQGGSLRITETIVFTFTEGTFREVFRVIPTGRTDGVEFVEAAMDGQVLSQGEKSGQVRVRRQNGLRIEWHFEPVANSTHTFRLTYLARGVVREDGQSDLLAWRALPNEHRYPIAASTIVINVPAPPQGELRVERQRVDGGARVTFADGRIVIDGTSIREDGWLQPEIRFARGDVLDALPAWQQRDRAQNAMMPTWLLIAAGTLIIGIGWLVLLRQGYDAPPPATSSPWTSVIPPDHTPPAIAAALAANGGPQIEHAMGALLTLAERGIVRISEQRGPLKQRDFLITSHGRPGALAPHEAAALDVIFAKHDPSTGVKLSKARAELTWHFLKFRDALKGEMQSEGLLDRGRQAHKRRYNRIGLIFLVLAAAAVVPVLATADRFGGWPFFVPLALALVGLASFIFAASETPLSNDGVRRAALWRGYQRHLRRPQDIEPRWGGSHSAEARILPYAVALGLASAWSKFMKKRGVTTPAWFHAASEHERGAAFAAFIASGGASAHGHGSGGHGVGGGVAGGGASGAR